MIPVILAGGGGTRLWPLSREYYPKQFTSIYNEYSLLQNTLTRLVITNGENGEHDTLSIGNPLILCNEEHRFLTLDQAKETGITLNTLILEPVGRNTAPALTCAAIHTQKGNPDVSLIMMPADHVILDPEKFRAAVTFASQFADQDKIVTFGIIPDKPETGYGYIRRGAEIDIDDKQFNSYQLAEFVEKPDMQTAVDYLESGDYFWNSGIFMLKGSKWLDLIRKYNPGMLGQCRKAYEKGEKDNQFLRLDKDEFERCESDSIDYAVMENLSEDERNNTIVVPLDAGWSDIGSWSSVHENKKKDVNRNAIGGDVITDDTTDSLIISGDRLLATVGCKNMIVVETSDAVLVADKKAAQKVKNIVQHLRDTNREERLLHRKVFRPWGSYESLDVGSNYQVKRLVVNPGKKLSLQMHHHRAEHWVVVEGIATVTKGEEVFRLNVNESTYIPLETKHRLENEGDEPLEVIEVQSGSYLGEDDIVRFDDDFGRH